MWENTMFGTETFGRPRKWSPGHGFGREIRYTLSFFTEIPKIAVPRPISAFPGPKIKLCIFSSSCSPGPDFSSAWTLPRPEIFLSCVRLLRKSQTLWEICVFLSGWGGVYDVTEVLQPPESREYRKYPTVTGKIGFPYFSVNTGKIAGK